MFDIGFAELIIIGIVGLLVIGPERLPAAIRTGALWLGRARRTYSSFRRDLENEIGADEIRRELYNETVMEQLKQTQQDLKSAGDEVRSALDSVNAEPASDQSVSESAASQTDGSPSEHQLSEHSSSSQVKRKSTQKPAQKPADSDVKPAQTNAASRHKEAGPTQTQLDLPNEPGND